MRDRKMFNIGDKVTINLKIGDDAITKGMLTYNGKTTTISKICRGIGIKRKKELEKELEGLSGLERSAAEKMILKLYSPYGYELAGVASPLGKPYIFTNDMLTEVD